MGNKTTQNTISFNAWVQSDVGKVRKNNEDNYLADTVNGLFVVADGMGGHEHGEVASQMAVEAIRSYLYNAMSGIKAYSMDPGPQRRSWIQDVVTGAIQVANAEVYRYAQSLGAQENMGTTLSMLLFIGPRDAVIGHVGDSRLYRIRSKEVTQLTEDHTVLQQQIKLGNVRPEDSEQVPYGHALTQAVGYRQEVQPDVYFLEIEPGDQFLLCSDGLYNYLIEDEIVTVYSESVGEKIVPRLIACANARGGRDNITAVALRVESPDDQVAATQLDLAPDILNTCPLFSSLEFQDVMRLMPMGEYRLFIRDEIIQTEGEEGAGIFLVIAGRVGLYRRGTWLTTLGPGGHFGDIDIFDDRGGAETAISEDEVRLVLFPKEAFRELLQKSPELGIKLLLNIGEFNARRTRNNEGRLSQSLGSS